MIFPLSGKGSIFISGIIFKTSNKPNLHGPTSNYDVDVLNAVSNHPKKVLKNILKITH